MTDTKLSHPHDHFMKELLSHPETAGALQRERLPEAVVECLSAKPPKLISSSFMDEALREHLSDRLFRGRDHRQQDRLPLCTRRAQEHAGSQGRLAAVQVLGRDPQAVGKEPSKLGSASGDRALCLLPWLRRMEDPQRISVPKGTADGDPESLNQGPPKSPRRPSSDHSLPDPGLLLR